MSSIALAALSSTPGFPGGTQSRRSLSVLRISEVNLDTWQHTLAVNLTAPWLLTRAALPGMLERGSGRIFYVSSVAALNGGVVGPNYAASKAGRAPALYDTATVEAHRTRGVPLEGYWSEAEQPVVPARAPATPAAS
jgi:NAD(P)-dependent dehydrogenase (short-subunit alcohol dehydrogenase family)